MKKISWDEQNLSLNDEYRASTTFTRIEEPKTPWAPPAWDDDGHDSEDRAALHALPGFRSGAPGAEEASRPDPGPSSAEWTLPLRGGSADPTPPGPGPSSAAGRSSGHYPYPPPPPPRRRASQDQEQARTARPCRRALSTRPSRAVA